MSLVQELSDDLQTIDKRMRKVVSKPWTERSKAFGQACIQAAQAAGDGFANLMARDLVDLAAVERLAAAAHKKDPPSMLALAQYLINLPGYQPKLAGSQSKMTRQQHEIVASQLVETGKAKVWQALD